MSGRLGAATAAAGEEPQWDIAGMQRLPQPGGASLDLPAAVAEELIALWGDLGEAMRRAGSRSWSVECDGLVVRIVMLSRLAAATSWQWIPVSLLASGVYQGILQSAGVTFTAPCAAEIQGLSIVGRPG